MLLLGLGSVPLNQAPSYLLDQFVQRSKRATRWSSSVQPLPQTATVGKGAGLTGNHQGSQFSGHNVITPEMSSILGPVRPGRKGEAEAWAAPGRLPEVSQQSQPQPRSPSAAAPTPESGHTLMTHVQGLSRSRHTHLCLCTPHWPTAPTGHGASTPVHTEVPIVASQSHHPWASCHAILHVRNSPHSSALHSGRPGFEVQGRKRAPRKPSVHLLDGLRQHPVQEGRACAGQEHPGHRREVARHCLCWNLPASPHSVAPETPCCMF